MYIVISKQNALSTSMPSVVPVFIHSHSQEAVKAAKKATENTEDFAYMSSIVVYEVEPGVLYNLSHFEKNKRVVFMLWKTSNGPQCWTEKYPDEFLHLKWSTVRTKDDYVAAKGMYRAVVAFDSDLEIIIGDDVSSRNVALKFCMDAGGDAVIFQIYNSQGIPQFVNGKFIPLPFEV